MIENELRNMRGKIVEEKIEVNINKIEEKLLKIRESVQEYYKFLTNN
jgi:hypothetical protein